MNPLSQSLVSIGRQIITGFLFTVGALGAVAISKILFHVGLCS